MKLYEITFKKSNDIYSANMIYAESAEFAEAWFIEHRIKDGRTAEIVGIREASNKPKPGQPVHTVPTDWTPTTAETTTEREETKPMKDTTYTIKRNEEHNGNEIYFTCKPDEETRTALKSLKFRWHGVKKCWYGRATAEQIAEAIGTAGTQSAPAAAPVAVKPALVKINLDGLEKLGKKNVYGAQFAALIRAELKARGAKGVTVRARKSGYTDGITATIQLQPEDFRSIEETAERFSLGNFYRRMTHGLYIGGSCYFEVRNEKEAEALKVQYIREQLYKLESLNIHYITADNYPQLTAAALERIQAIYKIVNAWNWDNSDIMTDYFDIGYYVDIDIKMPKDFTPAEKMTAEEAAQLKADREAEEAAQAARLEEYHRQEEERRRAAEEAERKAQEDAAAIYADITTEDAAEGESFFITALAQGFGKECNLEELKEDTARSTAGYIDAEIARKITFKTPEVFGKFCNMFLYDWTFCEGMGGTGTEDPRVNADNLRKLTKEQRESVKFYACKCIAVYLGDVLQFVINPEGYSYARYVYIPTETTIEEHAAEEIRAITEADTEKPDFYFPEDVTAQAQNLTPGEQVTIYQPDGIISNMICTTSGMISGTRAGTWAQYSGVYVTICNGKRANDIFLRNDKEAIIYSGLFPSLPESVIYSQVVPGKYGTLKESRNGHDLIRAIIKHYDTQNIKPVFDTVQR